MGIFDFFKKQTLITNTKTKEHVVQKETVEKKGPPGDKVIGHTDYKEPIYVEIEPKLSYIDKERIMVDRIIGREMEQFDMMPFQLNCPVKKNIKEGTHPFAYIDLNDVNQMVAKQEIEKINEYIIQAKDYIPRLTSDVKIDISKIVFQQFSKDYGYSRIICTPYTFKGKISKYPMSLLFMSRADISGYFETGELFYGKDGNIGKANVSILTKKLHWIFEFKTVGRTLFLFRAKTNLVQDENGLPSVVYEFRE